MEGSIGQWKEAQANGRKRRPIRRGLEHGLPKSYILPDEVTTAFRICFFI